MGQRADLVLPVSFVNPQTKIAYPYKAHLFNQLVYRAQALLRKPTAYNKQCYRYTYKQGGHAFKKIGHPFMPLQINCRNQYDKVSLVIVIINTYGLPVAFGKIAVTVLSYSVNYGRRPKLVFILYKRSFVFIVVKPYHFAGQALKIAFPNAA